METIKSVSTNPPFEGTFSAHFPARGWKRKGSPGENPSSFPLISPQGDGNKNRLASTSALPCKGNFSAHFPARGWKRKGLHPHEVQFLFRSFPRKGMETINKVCSPYKTTFFYFSAHFPARGWKQNTQPERSRVRYSFPLISPQGDGNNTIPNFLQGKWIPLFRSFPRKGMETAHRTVRRRSVALLFRSFPRKRMETTQVRKSDRLLACK